MGDRSNPIKFGPEWLRNLARERSAGGRTNTPSNSPRTGNSTSRPTGSQGSGIGSPYSTQGAGASMGTGSVVPPTPVSPPNVGSTASGVNSIPTAGTSSGTNTRNTTNIPVPKVQLAKLRYGREEMLALYDRTADAPEELRGFDLVYQPRGKPPFALNTFDEDMRGGPPTGTMPQERFGAGRGAGRGAIASEPRGKSRMPFVRPSSLTSGRGSAMYTNNTRSPGFSGTEEDNNNLSNRPWSASNGGAQSSSRPEQGEWAPNKMFRRRHPNNTNWRQTPRDEGDEWRNQETSRNRSNADKWDRDWSERTNQDRPQPWNSSRRPWLGDSQNNEENLPEWAVDNAEAGAGTFDASGAFHGYSNDDSNLPTTSQTTYPLTRSHTHGSFARSNTAEEGSEEWWASDKAKKLSPKRFEVGDNFKRSRSAGVGEPVASTSSNPGNSNKDDLQKIPERLEMLLAATKTDDNHSNEDTQEAIRQKFSESKTFDALMRSDIDFAEGNDDRGNFQSVMINPNNSLRQKHQNIVTSNSEPPIIQPANTGLLNMLHGGPLAAKNNENESNHTDEDKIVENLLDMTLEDPTPAVGPNNMTLQANASNNLLHQLPNNNPGLQLRIPNPIQSHSMAMNTGAVPKVRQTPIQNVGIQHSALNSSLGLSIGPSSNNGMVLPLPMPPVMQNARLNAMNTAMQSRAVMQNFQPSNGVPVTPAPNVSNNELFMAPNNAPQLPSSNEMPLTNRGRRNNYFPVHGLQHTNAQTFNSIYSNIIQNQNQQNTMSAFNLSDQWYYEDPKPWDDNKKTVQGPFSSKEMYNWYRAGFFRPSLMVRQAYETHLRPLGSYGPVVPFAPMDVLPPFPMPGFEARPQGYDMLNQQDTLGIEVVFNNFVGNVRMTPDALTLVQALSMTRQATEQPVVPSANRVEQIQFGIRTQRLEQRQMESLWGQPGTSQDLMWMQQSLNASNEASVNNLPMYFWDPQPTSAMTSNSILPEDVPKEMQTEDQILAQLRASQNLPMPSTAPFLNDSSTSSNSTSINTSSDAFSTVCATPELEKLQNLILSESVMAPSPAPEPNVENQEIEALSEKSEPTPEPPVKTQPVQTKQSTEKAQLKTETEKPAKAKEQSKGKKKAKEEKREDYEGKAKEEDVKSEKASAESSPTKTKKEDKQSKNELEKEKKEWIKEGFTIVKGSEKASKQETKKKAEENKAAEEADKKKKDEEKQLSEEERKRKLMEATNKQKEQQQRLILESLSKKAPWSTAQSTATNKDGLTLAEIQRLEREKKLQQIKEQQHMMQLIAQQHAAALATEQAINESQNAAWSKKKASNNSSPGQSLAEIQAETRRQSAQAAAVAAQVATQAAAQATAEEQVISQPQTNHTPWGNSHNGAHKKILDSCLPGGFWDTTPSTSAKPEKTQEPVGKPEKKKKIVVPPKKETSPAAEFEAWCGSALTSWSSKIDVPTFVGFLKDIESPYEVKDYVKCYLGESKEANDFARHFLERRSKLLRVGMVTPSDDLCSPAIAVNPRASVSDYQETKGKGKKSKKNKMLKVDARILGFSVTASEDRINVGDIDTV